ncbi:uncharacterized protein LOC121388428 [Gigantopelta aegis]|uniref:uncharacterized protein LOC121388428 n=1 Tax=Gigantopelta aegis TaxID=1735272 RepID=UPI001B88A379|nr:uncharacterized protein LOC121388428 [Gigantopelta aegis]
MDHLQKLRRIFLTPTSSADEGNRTTSGHSAEHIGDLTTTDSNAADVGELNNSAVSGLHETLGETPAIDANVLADCCEPGNDVSVPVEDEPIVETTGPIDPCNDFEKIGREIVSEDSCHKLSSEHVSETSAKDTNVFNDVSELDSAACNRNHEAVGEFKATDTNMLNVLGELDNSTDGRQLSESVAEIRATDTVTNSGEKDNSVKDRKLSEPVCEIPATDTNMLTEIGEQDNSVKDGKLSEPVGEIPATGTNMLTEIGEQDNSEKDGKLNETVSEITATDSDITDFGELDNSVNTLTQDDPVSDTTLVADPCRDGENAECGENIAVQDDPKDPSDHYGLLQDMELTLAGSSLNSSDHEEQQGSEKTQQHSCHEKSDRVGQLHNVDAREVLEHSVQISASAGASWCTGMEDPIPMTMGERTLPTDPGSPSSADTDDLTCMPVQISISECEFGEEQTRSDVDLMCNEQDQTGSEDEMLEMRVDCPIDEQSSGVESADEMNNDNASQGKEFENKYHKISLDTFLRKPVHSEKDSSSAEGTSRNSVDMKMFNPDALVVTSTPTKKSCLTDFIASPSLKAVTNQDLVCFIQTSCHSNSNEESLDVLQTVVGTVGSGSPDLLMNQGISEKGSDSLNINANEEAEMSKHISKESVSLNNEDHSFGKSDGDVSSSVEESFQDRDFHLVLSQSADSVFFRSPLGHSENNNNYGDIICQHNAPCETVERNAESNVEISHSIPSAEIADKNTKSSETDVIKRDAGICCEVASTEVADTNIEHSETGVIQSNSDISHNLSSAVVVDPISKIAATQKDINVCSDVDPAEIADQAIINSDAGVAENIDTAGEKQKVTTLADDEEATDCSLIIHAKEKGESPIHAGEADEGIQSIKSLEDEEAAAGDSFVETSDKNYDLDNDSTPEISLVLSDDDEEDEESVTMSGVERLPDSQKDGEDSVIMSGVECLPDSQKDGEDYVVINGVERLPDSQQDGEDSIVMSGVERLPDSQQDGEDSVVMSGVERLPDSQQDGEDSVVMSGVERLSDSNNCGQDLVRGDGLPDIDNCGEDSVTGEGLPTAENCSEVSVTMSIVEQRSSIEQEAPFVTSREEQPPNSENAGEDFVTGNEDQPLLDRQIHDRSNEILVQVDGEIRGVEYTFQGEENVTACERGKQIPEDKHCQYISDSPLEVCLSSDDDGNINSCSAMAIEDKKGSSDCHYSYSHITTSAIECSSRHSPNSSSNDPKMDRVEQSHPYSPYKSVCEICTSSYECGSKHEADRGKSLNRELDKLKPPETKIDIGNEDIKHSEGKLCVSSLGEVSKSVTDEAGNDNSLRDCDQQINLSVLQKVQHIAAQSVDSENLHRVHVKHSKKKYKMKKVLSNFFKLRKKYYDTLSTVDLSAVKKQNTKLYLERFFQDNPLKEDKSKPTSKILDQTKSTPAKVAVSDPQANTVVTKLKGTLNSLSETNAVEVQSTSGLSSTVFPSDSVAGLKGKLSKGNTNVKNSAELRHDEHSTHSCMSPSVIESGSESSEIYCPRLPSQEPGVESGYKMHPGTAGDQPQYTAGDMIHSSNDTSSGPSTMASLNCDSITNELCLDSDQTIISLYNSCDSDATHCGPITANKNKVQNGSQDDSTSEGINSLSSDLSCNTETILAIEEECDKMASTLVAVLEEGPKAIGATAKNIKSKETDMVLKENVASQVDDGNGSMTDWSIHSASIEIDIAQSAEMSEVYVMSNNNKTGFFEDERSMTDNLPEKAQTCEDVLKTRSGGIPVVQYASVMGSSQTVAHSSSTDIGHAENIHTGVTMTNSFSDDAKGGVNADVDGSGIASALSEGNNIENVFPADELIMDSHSTVDDSPHFEDSTTENTFPANGLILDNHSTVEEVVIDVEENTHRQQKLEQDGFYSVSNQSPVRIKLEVVAEDVCSHGNNVAAADEVIIIDSDSEQEYIGMESRTATQKCLDTNRPQNILKSKIDKSLPSALSPELNRDNIVMRDGQKKKSTCEKSFDKEKVYAEKKKSPQKCRKDGLSDSGIRMDRKSASRKSSKQCSDSELDSTLSPSRQKRIESVGKKDSPGLLNKKFARHRLSVSKVGLNNKPKSQTSPEMTCPNSNSEGTLNPLETANPKADIEGNLTPLPLGTSIDMSKSTSRDSIDDSLDSSSELPELAYFMGLSQTSQNKKVADEETHLANKNVSVDELIDPRSSHNSTDSSGMMDAVNKDFDAPCTSWSKADADDVFKVQSVEDKSTNTRDKPINTRALLTEKITLPGSPSETLPTIISSLGRRTEASRYRLSLSCKKKSIKLVTTPSCSNIQGKEDLDVSLRKQQDVQEDPEDRISIQDCSGKVEEGGSSDLSTTSSSECPDVTEIRKDQLLLTLNSSNDLAQTKGSSGIVANVSHGASWSETSDSSEVNVSSLGSDISVHTLSSGYDSDSWMKEASAVEDHSHTKRGKCALPSKKKLKKSFDILCSGEKSAESRFTNMHPSGNDDDDDDGGLPCPSGLHSLQSDRRSSLDSNSSSASTSLLPNDMITSAIQSFSPDVVVRSTSATQPSSSEVMARSTSATQPSSSEVMARSTSATQPSSSEVMVRSTSATQPSSSEVMARSTSATQPSSSEVMVRSTSATQPSSSEVMVRSTSATQPSSSEVMAMSTSALSVVVSPVLGDPGESAHVRRPSVAEFSDDSSDDSSHVDVSKIITSLEKSEEAVISKPVTDSASGIIELTSKPKPLSSGDSDSCSDLPALEPADDYPQSPVYPIDGVEGNILSLEDDVMESTDGISVPDKKEELRKRADYSENDDSDIHSLEDDVMESTDVGGGAAGKKEGFIESGDSSESDEDSDEEDDNEDNVNDDAVDDDDDDDRDSDADGGMRDSGKDDGNSDDYECDATERDADESNDNADNDGNGNDSDRNLDDADDNNVDGTTDSWKYVADTDKNSDAVPLNADYDSDDNKSNHDDDWKHDDVDEDSDGDHVVSGEGHHDDTDNKQIDGHNAALKYAHDDVLECDDVDGASNDDYTESSNDDRTCDDVNKNDDDVDISIDERNYDDTDNKQIDGHNDILVSGNVDVYTNDDGQNDNWVYENDDLKYGCINIYDGQDRIGSDHENDEVNRLDDDSAAFTTRLSGSDDKIANNRLSRTFDDYDSLAISIVGAGTQCNDENAFCVGDFCTNCEQDEMDVVPCTEDEDSSSLDDLPLLSGKRKLQGLSTTPSKRRCRNSSKENLVYQDLVCNQSRHALEDEVPIPSQSGSESDEQGPVYNQSKHTLEEHGLIFNKSRNGQESISAKETATKPKHSVDEDHSADTSVDTIFPATQALDDLSSSQLSQMDRRLDKMVNSTSGSLKVNRMLQRLRAKSRLADDKTKTTAGKGYTAGSHAHPSGQPTPSLDDSTAGTSSEGNEDDVMKIETFITR